MDKTYTFKFYNRYSITLKDSNNIGRKKLYDKAKQIVDAKINLQDNADDFIQLGNAISSLTWDKLDNPTYLLDKIKPLFKEALDTTESKTIGFEFDPKEARQNLTKYIQTNLPTTKGINFTIDDIYDSQKMQDIRNALAQPKYNASAITFDQIINDSKVFEYYKLIEDEIQSLSARYLRKNFTGSFLDAATFDKFVDELNKENIKITQEKVLESPEGSSNVTIGDAIKLLKTEIQNENKVLSKLVSTYTSKDFPVDILDPQNIEAARLLIDKTKQFDIRLNAVTSPYQKKIVTQAVNDAYDKLMVSAVAYQIALTKYKQAAEDTTFEGKKYYLLLLLKDDYNRLRTKENFKSKIAQLIEQFPQTLKEIDRELTILTNFDDVNSETKRLLTSYRDYWLKEAKSSGIVSEDQDPLTYVYSYSDLDLINGLAAMDLEDKELAEVNKDFNKEYLSKHKELTNIHQLNLSSINTQKYFWEESEDKFYTARHNYTVAYNNYIDAIDEYHRTIFSAIHNYGIYKKDSKTEMPKLVNYDSYEEKLRNFIKEQAEYETNSLTHINEVEINEDKAKQIDAAFKFINENREEIMNIAAQKDYVESGLPKFDKFPQFIDWFKRQAEVCIDTADGNEYLEQVIIPKLEELNPTVDTPQNQAKAFNSILDVLNKLFENKNKNTLFASKTDLTNMLNSASSKGSALSYLDVLYNYLKEPIEANEKVDEEGTKLTLTEIMQNRIAKWFTDTFKDDGEFLLANPYMDTLISSVLFKTKRDAQMMYSVEQFKNKVNKFLYEANNNEEMRTERHKSAFELLKESYKNNRSQIDQTIVKPLIERINSISSNNEKKKEFTSKLPGIIGEIKKLLSNYKGYSRLGNNGTHIISPTVVQQGWIDATMEILLNAAKEEGKPENLLDIMDTMFTSEFTPSFYNDVRTHVHQHLQNEVHVDPRRNISNALEHYLKKPKEGEEPTELQKHVAELVDKFNDGSLTPGEFAEDFLQSLHDADVLANASTTNPVALLATKNFESTVRAILQGGSASYNKENKYNQTTIGALWSYLDNYILKANGYYTISKLRNWERPMKYFETDKTETDVGTNISKLEKRSNERSVRPDTVATLLEKKFNGTLHDSTAVKYCLACNRPLKHRKDSDLYQCPYCQIIYSKSMLK